MCLRRNLEENPLLIATEDITCYKAIQVPDEYWYKLKTWILRKLRRFREYETYFIKDPIVIGEVFIAKPVLSTEQLKHLDKTRFCLEEGFVHSFVNKRDAFCFATPRLYMDVVECIIPKGTYYFKGLNSDKTEGYASTSLKYVKIIR